MLLNYDEVSVSACSVVGDVDVRNVLSAEESCNVCVVTVMM